MQVFSTARMAACQNPSRLADERTLRMKGILDLRMI